MRENSSKFDLLQSIATYGGRPKSMLSVNPAELVLNKPLDTLASCQNQNVVYLAANASLQQEMDESPDIVQQHREYEVKQSYTQSFDEIFVKKSFYRFVFVLNLSR